jgi:hypothetical protein
MQTSMNYQETVDLISAVGHEVTCIVQGHIGSGKSSLIDALHKRFPNHRKVYMDMTVMHEGDFRIPAVNHDTKTTEFYYNESFGLHDDVPVLLMLDEMGKSPRPTLNASLPLLVDRRAGNRYLHSESIVFGTTNKGSENVGDVFQGHHRNRVSFTDLEKMPAPEWVDTWARFNDIAPEIIMWVGERPEALHPFEMYDNPDDNPLIYHPKAQRSAFVTHRSLAQASKIVNKRGMFTKRALENALMGTIGAPATVDLQAWIQMGDSLPRRAEIIAGPKDAPMPKEIAGKMMLTHQALNWVTEDTLDSWMDYMARMPKEMQALFCTTIVKKPNKDFAMENSKFTDFAIANQYLFA